MAQVARLGHRSRQPSPCCLLLHPRRDAAPEQRGDPLGPVLRGRGSLQERGGGRHPGGKRLPVDVDQAEAHDSLAVADGRGRHRSLRSPRRAHRRLDGRLEGDPDVLRPRPRARGGRPGDRLAPLRRPERGGVLVPRRAIRPGWRPRRVCLGGLAAGRGGADRAGAGAGDPTALPDQRTDPQPDRPRPGTPGDPVFARRAGPPELAHRP